MERLQLKRLFNIKQELRAEDWIIAGFLFLHCLFILPHILANGYCDVSLAILFLFVVGFHWNKIPWTDFFKHPLILCFLLLVFLRVFPTFFQDVSRSTYYLSKWPMRGVLTLLVYYSLLAVPKKPFYSRISLSTIPFIYIWTLTSGYFFYFVVPEWQIRPNFEIFELYYNSTARFLNLFIPIFLAFALNAKSPLKKSLSLVFSILGIIAILLTQSRGGLISLVIILVIFFFLYSLKTFDFKTFFVSLLIILIILSVILLILPVDDSLTRFRKKGLSAHTRFTIIWPNTINLIKERPIVGYPVGSFTPNIRVPSGKGYAHAHNVFLQNLYEGGILGLLAYLWFLGYFSYWLLRYYVYHDEKWIYAISLISGLVGVMIVHGLVADVNVYWMGLYVAFALVLLGKSQRPAEATSNN